MTFSIMTLSKTIENAMLSITTFGITIAKCDAQHNDTQHNDTQHNDTQHNDTQHNDTKHNDTKYNNCKIRCSL
jgi:hypothetical protein